MKWVAQGNRTPPSETLSTAKDQNQQRSKPLAVQKLVHPNAHGGKMLPQGPGMAHGPLQSTLCISKESSNNSQTTTMALHLYTCLHTLSIHA